MLAIPCKMCFIIQEPLSGFMLILFSSHSQKYKNIKCFRVYIYILEVTILSHSDANNL